jgi:hypothetical protein
VEPVGRRGPLPRKQSSSRADAISQQTGVIRNGQRSVDCIAEHLARIEFVEGASHDLYAELSAPLNAGQLDRASPAGRVVMSGLPGVDRAVRALDRRLVRASSEEGDSDDGWLLTGFAASLAAFAVTMGFYDTFSLSRTCSCASSCSACRPPTYSCRRFASYTEEGDTAYYSCLCLRRSQQVGATSKPSIPLRQRGRVRLQPARSQFVRSNQPPTSWLFRVREAKVGACHH